MKSVLSKLLSRPIGELEIGDLRPLSDEDSEFLLDMLLKHYRKEGYPHQASPSSKELTQWFETLRHAKPCLNNGIMSQNIIGLVLANSFHPEMADVKCRDCRSPMETYEDDYYFKKALKRAIDAEDKITLNVVRRYIENLGNTQKAGNFRPVAARDIYKHFKAKLVVDWCAGWGARVLGALASNTSYIGIDPNLQAIEGNRKMCIALKKQFPDLRKPVLVCACAEELLGNNFFSPDLIFTSPPYYNTEKYSTESTQSYLRYPEEELWWKKFFRRCCAGSFKDLKDDGHLVLHISGPMRERVIENAEYVGFKLKEEWQFSTSKRQYNIKSDKTPKDKAVFRGGNNNKDAAKNDPVLVFTKK